MYTWKRKKLMPKNSKKKSNFKRLKLLKKNEKELENIQEKEKKH